MKYVHEPSLEHMANIKIVTMFCNQADVKDLLKEFYIPSYYTGFQSKREKIEAIVEKKVAKLPLSKLMKEEILCLIRPVGFQVSKWWQFHNRCYNLSINLPKEFSWTPEGTIDRKKTAEMMIKDESMEITTRYILACIYCLEDDIKELWDKLPEGSRKCFYSQEDPIHVMQNELVIFWTYHIKGEVDKMNSIIEKRMDRQCSPYRYAFKIAANGGNRVATEYFLLKLTSAEREESLVKTAIRMPRGESFYFSETNGFMKETFSHILCFLLCELNEEQQIKVFKSYPCEILTCFLDWPLQIFFMKTAHCMWNFLSENTFCKVLLCIIDKIKHGYKDSDYRKLLGEFWEQNPNNYKKHVFSVHANHLIVSNLFEIRDKNNINLIFQDVTPKDRKYLIYDNNAQDICKELMYGNQLSLLEFFIKECLPSEEEVVKFKEDFKNGDVWNVTTYLISKQKFLLVLDNVICEFRKRNCEEGDRNKAKKVCSANSKLWTYHK